MSKNTEDESTTEENAVEPKKNTDEILQDTTIGEILKDIDYSMLNKAVRDNQDREPKIEQKEPTEPKSAKEHTKQTKRKELKRVRKSFSDFSWIWDIGFQLLNGYFQKYEVKPLTEREQQELKGSIENVIFNSFASADLKVVKRVARLTENSDFVQLGYTFMKVLLPRFLALGQKRKENKA